MTRLGFWAGATALVLGACGDDGSNTSGGAGSGAATPSTGSGQGGDGDGGDGGSSGTAMTTSGSGGSTMTTTGSGGSTMTTTGSGGSTTTTTGSGGSMCIKCSAVILQMQDPANLCPSSKPIFDALQKCACVEKCATQCEQVCNTGMDPNMTCQPCVLKECGMQAQACLGDK
jgi:hypothetical protein